LVSPEIAARGIRTASLRVEAVIGAFAIALSEQRVTLSEASTRFDQSPRLMRKSIATHCEVPPGSRGWAPSASSDRWTRR
jgi:hypothetical protein